MSIRSSLIGRIHLATLAEDAPQLARARHLGLELDHFCTPHNLDRDFEIWDARVRADIEGIDRLILHAPFAELTPCAIDPMVRDVAMHRLSQSVDLCRSYGIRRMVVHSGFMPRVYFPVWYLEQASAFFRELLARCPEDFELLIENVLDPEPELLLDTVRAIDDPRAKLCLDVGHAHVASEVPVLDWLNCLAPALGHLHLHDNSGDFDVHAIPGDGSIGFPKLFEDVHSAAPHASITLECADALGCIRRLQDWGLLTEDAHD